MVLRRVVHLYGSVERPEDLRLINEKIREEMERVETSEQLTELKKRSDYFCTLTFSSAWRRRFGDNVGEFLDVCLEENRKTVARAIEIALQHGFDVDYQPWRIRYRRSDGAGDGILRYLVYRSPQRMANGEVRERVRVKRLYFPASATGIQMQGPGYFQKRTGRRFYGVLVHYRHQPAPAAARGGVRPLTPPGRWAEGVTIVELSEQARDVQLREEAPPRQRPDAA
jgi:hypothetical protein